MQQKASADPERQSFRVDENGKLIYKAIQPQPKKHRKAGQIQGKQMQQKASADPERQVQSSSSGKQMQQQESDSEHLNFATWNADAWCFFGEHNDFCQKDDAEREDHVMEVIKLLQENSRPLDVLALQEVSGPPTQKNLERYKSMKQAPEEIDALANNNFWNLLDKKMQKELAGDGSNMYLADVFGCRHWNSSGTALIVRQTKDKCKDETIFSISNGKTIIPKGFGTIWTKVKEEKGDWKSAIVFQHRSFIVGSLHLKSGSEKHELRKEQWKTLQNNFHDRFLNNQKYMVSAAEANVVLGGDFNWYDQDKSLDPFDKVSKGPEHGDYRVEGLNLKFKDAHYEYSLGKAGSKAESTKDRQNFKS
jgi:hypothetical protein